MSFLSNLFSSRRELKRLAESVEYWRGKAEVLEKERKYLIDLLLNRDFAWSDRFLTSIAKTYPISAEVKAKVESNSVIKSAEYQQELTSYLLDQKLSYEQDAIAANVPLEKAQEDYRKAEPELIKQFEEENQFGFSN